MGRSSQSSAGALQPAPSKLIQPGSGLLLLVEAMADCEERMPHDDIFKKLEAVLKDSIATAIGNLDPTPEQIEKIRLALAS